MSNNYFNPIASFVTIKFKCTCGEECVTDALYVPTPDYLAETSSDSMNWESFEIQCDSCGKEYEISVYNSYYGGEVEINNDAEIIDIEEDMPEEDNFDDFYYLKTEIEKTLDKIDSIPEDLQPFIIRLLYANAITYLETYLFETLKSQVFQNENSLRNFVEKYEPFNNEDSFKYRLANIFQVKDNLKSHVEKELNGLLYHNLPKIKNIYRTILDIDLGEIKECCKAVKIRHDIIHRNGKDIEGKEHEITKEDVSRILNHVNKIKESIENQINPLFNNETSDFLNFQSTNPFDD